MIIKFKAKAPNGLSIDAKIDLTIVSLSFGTGQSQNPNPISPRAFSETSSILTELLSQYFPHAMLGKLQLEIISKDLENMQSLGIRPDADSLSKSLAIATLHYIAQKMAYEPSKDTDLKSYLQAHEADFLRIFCQSPQKPQTNSQLRRVRELFNDKKHQEAFRLLATIDGKITNDADRLEADFLAFALRIKSSGCNFEKIEAEFNEALTKVGEHPDYCTKYYFEYIRFLENSRDYYRPLILLQDFQKKYPLQLLDQTDKTTYYHLLGRAEYARGDYLLALQNFSLALQNLDPEDSENKAKIFNSSVNCFNDNLFFDEALWIARQASELRSLLNLPENLETLSCIAGIRTKQNNHSEALELLKEVENKSSAFSLTSQEQNRLNNYLAKSLVFMQDYEQAEIFLAKAESAGDPKGFSRQLRLLMLLQQRDFAKMERLFNSVFLLPENHDHKKGLDRFVLGWAYTLMGEAALLQGRYKDAVLYLSDGINFFLCDKYILEAKYASLLTWIYSLPEPYAGGFRQIKQDLELDKLFDEYARKHSPIAKEYYAFYQAQNPKKKEQSALAVLAASLKDIDDCNYNPAEIKELFASICLI